MRRLKKFGIELKEEEFNQRQVFVVMTNGLDYKTREAVQYWRSCSLDVRPWVYRVYEGGLDGMLLEISASASRTTLMKILPKAITSLTQTILTTKMIMMIC